MDALNLDQGLSFGQALEALKAGKMVARKGWNGKGMFLYLVEGSEVEFQNLRGNAKNAAELAIAIETNGVAETAMPDKKYKIGSHIDMKAADGTLVIGWLASQTDMLANDWNVIN